MNEQAEVQTTRYFFAGDNEDNGPEFTWLSEAQAHRDTSGETGYRIGMIYRANGRTRYFDVDSTEDNLITPEELALLKLAEAQAQANPTSATVYDGLLTLLGECILTRCGYRQPELAV